MALSVYQALEHWEKEGHLTKKKVDELRASLPDADSNHAIRIFSALGAVLVGLGIILFVASNWSSLTPLFKVVLLMVAMLSTGWIGYYYAYEKKMYEKTGLALLFINVFVFGASIFLIGQIYNLPLNFWWGMLLWFLGAAFFAYILESKLHLWLSVPLFIFFLGWLRTEVALGFSEVDFLFDERANILSLLPVIGLGLTSLAVLHRSHKNLRFGESTLFHWGIFLVLFSVVVSTVDKEIFFPVFDLTFDRIAVIIIAVSVFLGIGAMIKGKFQTPQGRYAIAALGAYLLFLYSIAHVPQLMGFQVSYMNSPPMVSGLYVLHVLLAFVLLMTVIWYGTMLRLPGYINMGIIGLAFAILIQYFTWAFELLDRSVFFIIGGALILALSAVLERQRRKLVTSITKS